MFGDGGGGGGGSKGGGDGRSGRVEWRWGGVDVVGWGKGGRGVLGRLGVILIWDGLGLVGGGMGNGRLFEGIYGGTS